MPVVYDNQSCCRLKRAKDTRQPDNSRRSCLRVLRASVPPTSTWRRLQRQCSPSNRKHGAYKISSQATHTPKMTKVVRAADSGTGVVLCAQKHRTSRVPSTQTRRVNSSPQGCKFKNVPSATNILRRGTMFKKYRVRYLKASPWIGTPLSLGRVLLSLRGESPEVGPCWSWQGPT